MAKISFERYTFEHVFTKRKKIIIASTWDDAWDKLNDKTGGDHYSYNLIKTKKVENKNKAMAAKKPRRRTVGRGKIKSYKKKTKQGNNVTTTYVPGKGNKLNRKVKSWSYNGPNGRKTVVRTVTEKYFTNGRAAANYRKQQERR